MRRLDVGTRFSKVNLTSGVLISINVEVMVNTEMDCCSICMYAYFMR